MVTSEQTIRRVKNILRRENTVQSNQITQAIASRKMLIIAKANKIKRYDKRDKEKKQNQMFKEDQGRFYRELRNDSIKVSNPPPKEEVDRFWKGIYEDERMFNNQAEWLEQIKNSQETTNIEQMEHVAITKKEIEDVIKKSSNWKTPGPDRVQNVWLKKIRTLLEPLTACYNRIINGREEIPQWLTTGETVLIPKSEETQRPEKYRPITCLPTLYKVFTGVLAKRIQGHLDNNNIISEEQKGCCKNSYGTKDQLLINKMITENSRRAQKNLSMVWIDYKKAYDSVPHNWIREVLKIYKISPEIIRFIDNAMKIWKVNINLHYEEGTLEIEEVKIKRGIFQGDSISPLIFVLAINPLSALINGLQNGYRINSRNEKKPKIISHLFYMDDLKLYSSNREETIKQIEIVKRFSNDICMEFGLDKCAFVLLKKGRRIESENIEIEGDIIKELEQERTYKYLGIEESEKIENNIMKGKIKKEYRRRLKLILKSELNPRNKMQAINTLAIPVLSYGFGIKQAECYDQKNAART